MWWWRRRRALADERAYEQTRRDLAQQKWRRESQRLDRHAFEEERDHDDD